MTASGQVYAVSPIPPTSAFLQMFGTRPLTLLSLLCQGGPEERTRKGDETMTRADVAQTCYLFVK